MSHTAYPGFCFAEYEVVHSVLVSGLLQQNTRDWVVYKQQKLISRSSGGWKSEVKVGSLVLAKALFSVADCRLLIVSYSLVLLTRAPHS